MLDSPYQWNTGVDGVVDAYAAMVYRLALTRVRTVPDAEDVFQACGILKRNEPLRTRNTARPG